MMEVDSDDTESRGAVGGAPGGHGQRAGIMHMPMFLNLFGPKKQEYIQEVEDENCLML